MTANFQFDPAIEVDPYLLILSDAPSSVNIEIYFTRSHNRRLAYPRLCIHEQHHAPLRRAAFRQPGRPQSAAPFRPSAGGHSAAALQHPHGAGLHGLDQTLHPVPWQAPSPRDGGGGSGAVLDPSGGGGPGGGFHAKPGLERLAVLISVTLLCKFSSRQPSKKGRCA
jgi:hypothetical protein